MSVIPTRKLSPRDLHIIEMWRRLVEAWVTLHNRAADYGDKVKAEEYAVQLRHCRERLEYYEEGGQ